MKGIGSFMAHILVLAFFILEACAAGPNDPLRSGPWKGKIVDIDTKELIEGAVVVAVWERVYRTPAGPNSYFYEAKEVVTDKEGKFEIPAYRPVNLLPLISYLRGPAFTIFKPGYLSLSSRHLEENIIDSSAEFTSEGKTYRLAPGRIELPMLKTREERVNSLNNVEGYPVGYAPHSKLRSLLQLIDIENKTLGFR